VIIRHASHSTIAIRLLATALLALSTLASGEAARAATRASTEPNTGYVLVDGIHVYYEVHGAGEPLVLLHGGLVTIDLAYAALLPALATDRQVIAIEQQGHGRTADREEPLTYKRMAEDTVAVLKHLNIERADFYGYSMGGGIALELGVSHPEVVRKLIVASAPFSNEGLYPGVLDGIAQLKPDDLAGSGLPEAYAAVAPNPERWPILVEKIKQLDLEFKGWTPTEIRSIAAPTLVVVGDSDNVTVPHAAQLFELLGGGLPGDFAGLPDSQLAVLPGTTHIGVVLENSDWLLMAIRSFLATPNPSDV
jgi:pimeloyl-ACP methyl ester carboxylesterase